tara:strand:+ start:80 stop:466 length:387 start_codon:yes stop_codon:yes gene_type:complete
MAVDDGLLGAAPLDPVEEDGDPSLSEDESEESEESGAEMDDEGEPAEQPRTSAYRHQRRGQPGRRRPRASVRLVGSVAGFDPTIMAQVDSAVGSSVGDDDGAEEGDSPEDDADDGAPNGQSQARLCRS